MEQMLHYYFNFTLMHQALPALLKGMRVTVEIAAVTVVGGLTLGLLLASLRAFGIRWINLLIMAYADMFRALPPLVVIVLLYFALPAGGIVFSPFWCASVGLMLVLGAVAEESFWAGVISIPHGQWEAARASGVSFVTTLALVIMPQAVQIVLPPLTNKTISITKNTALASVVAEPELLNQAMTMQGVYANPSPLIAGAVLYVLIFLPFVILTRWLETRSAH